MQSTAKTVEEYMAEVPAERGEAMEKLRAVINRNLPKGYKECMSYGMIGWVVPHSIYPAGYHCDPKLPLGLMNLASQKNFIALHHLGLYGSPTLLEWFVSEYAKQGVGKLDMGKGCVRFKKPENIPFDLIGKLVAKLPVQDYIKVYEAAFKSKKATAKTKV